MSKRMVLFFPMYLLFCISQFSIAQEKSSFKKDRNEKLIDVLVSAKGFGRVYYEDGASDGTVLDINPNEAYSEKSQHPAVKAIIRLGPKAIPLLIEHLDDIRPTHVSADVGRPWIHYDHVPLGHICLDILTKILKQDSSFWDAETADGDGLGIQFKRGYYFRPDDYIFSKETREIRVKNIVMTVKNKWLQLYKSGKLHYKCPDEWCVEAKEK